MKLNKTVCAGLFAVMLANNANADDIECVYDKGAEVIDSCDGDSICMGGYAAVNMLQCGYTLITDITPSIGECLEDDSAFLKDEEAVACVLENGDDSDKCVYEHSVRRAINCGVVKTDGNNSKSNE